MSKNLWGKYRAEVISVDDPEQRGRILVKAPSVLGDYELGWAEACLLPGVFMLPEVGDSVYIEFERGEIEIPIWVGILPTKNYIKKFFPDSNYDPSKKIILDAEIVNNSL